MKITISSYDVSVTAEISDGTSITQVVEVIKGLLISNGWSEELIDEYMNKNGGAKIDILAQAQANNKEEMCQFVSDYLDDAADGMTAEEYYDQTFGGNNE